MVYRQDIPETSDRLLVSAWSPQSLALYLQPSDKAVRTVIRLLRIVLDQIAFQASAFRNMPVPDRVGLIGLSLPRL